MQLQCNQFFICYWWTKGCFCFNLNGIGTAKSASIAPSSGFGCLTFEWVVSNFVCRNSQPVLHHILFIEQLVECWTFISSLDRRLKTSYNNILLLLASLLFLLIGRLDFRFLVCFYAYLFHYFMFSSQC